MRLFWAYEEERSKETIRPASVARPPIFTPSIARQSAASTAPPPVSKPTIARQPAASIAPVTSIITVARPIPPTTAPPAPIPSAAALRAEVTPATQQYVMALQIHHEDLRSWAMAQRVVVHEHHEVREHGEVEQDPKRVSGPSKRKVVGDDDDEHQVVPTKTPKTRKRLSKHQKRRMPFPKRPRKELSWIDCLRCYA